MLHNEPIHRVKPNEEPHFCALLLSFLRGTFIILFCVFGPWVLIGLGTWFFKLCFKIMKFFFLFCILLSLTCCRIPIVGNSPEEIKHREHPTIFEEPKQP